MGLFCRTFGRIDLELLKDLSGLLVFPDNAAMYSAFSMLPQSCRQHHEGNHEDNETNERPDDESDASQVSWAATIKVVASSNWRRLPEQWASLKFGCSA